MEKILFTIILLFLSAITLSAQPLGQSQDDQKTIEIRQQIGLNYSMPDYSVKKIDEKVIGPRLAKQLQFLMSNYKESTINDMLSAILYEQTGGLRYTEVTKIKILKISKQGDTITIRMKASLATNPQKLSTSEILMTFVDGLSDCRPTNSIFSHISRYIKE